ADDVDFSDEQTKDPMARRETLELVRTYYSIKTPLVRKRVSDMVKSIAVTLAGE
ncbi:MAG: transcriptional regulator, partial [Alphaproteobacteria bacterium]